LAAYKFDPGSLGKANLGMMMTGNGLLTVGYFGTFHQILKKNHPKLSTGILSALSAGSILLIVAASGGIESPYYSLWLLVIVVAGFFGTTSTWVIIASTFIFFGIEIYVERAKPGAFAEHLPPLIITVATAILAEWLHYQLRHHIGKHDQVAKLSGKLNAEMLKSNAIVRSVGEGVIVVNTSRQIQLFNPAATRMTGWDERSAKNLDYRTVLNLHDGAGNKLDDKNDPFASVWDKGVSMVRSDLTIGTKGGRTVAVSLSLSPIFDSDKRISGGIALFRDISLEKDMERQRNEFISTASHEMRTPVAAVEGYLSLAMNPAVSTIDNRAKDYLEKAHAATQHLGELFRDLLTITKLEDATKQEVVEVFDLTKALKEIVSDMQFTAKKKNMQIQFGTAGDGIRKEHMMLPVYAVKGNPQRIREVIMNFIENSIKYTPEGGSVYVTISGAPDIITVSVTDTGIGIAPEDIPHLFQKFYRVDNSKTRTIGGTGLGLYLSRAIIERLGGRIWVESKLGEGSSFKFTLPRQSSQAITITDTKSKPGAKTGLTAGRSGASAPTSAPTPALTPAQKAAAAAKARAAAGVATKASRVPARKVI
jgi:PAS domain S-box-containing protein